MAIALKVDVPWDQANSRHTWRLELVDADGQLMLLGATEDEEGKPVEIEQEFEIGRPAGVKPGTALDFVVAINIQPLPLEPGRQYAWQLTIDGDTQDDWRLPFSTRPASS